jgi:hypothetical protein
MSVCFVDTYMGGCFLVFGTALAAVVGLIVARRFTDLKTLTECHEVGNALLTVVGTMYAVLLGLVVVDSIAKFQKAGVIVEQEANTLADVFLLSERFPEPKRLEVQRLCKEYADDVVNREWKEMARGSISHTARSTVIALTWAVCNFEPVTENQKSIYPVAVTQACQLWDNRRARINMSLSTVPAPEWVVLIVGGLVTISFTYFFGLENLRVQIAMTSMVAVLIALNVLLVVMFGNPFSGEVMVHPDALRVDQAIFDNRLSGISGPLSMVRHPVVLLAVRRSRSLVLR